MTPEVRHVPVAISAETSMLQWARQDHAGAGSTIVVASEIAARIRNGVGWRRPDAVAIAVLAHPRTLGPDAVDLAWLVAGLGVAAALDELTADTHVCSWPDRIENSSQGLDDDDDRPEVVISASSSLGPGRVEHVILVARVSGASRLTNPPLIPVVVRHLQASALLLDEPDRVLASYRDRCPMLGTRVAVKLLPSGTIRGLACDVGRDGSLVIESPTGMREHVSVASLDHVSSIPE